ncbi:transposase [Nonomuraea longispora]|uniref:transposase n=1 Tax=Nonomuraea longispora TaxID=1848320 RepID=UPI003CCC63EC
MSTIDHISRVEAPVWANGSRTQRHFRRPLGLIEPTRALTAWWQAGLDRRPTADAAKKIVGRKRGIVTDALGLLLDVTVTAASLSENAVGIQLLNDVKETHPTITKAWVDTGFKNAAVEHGARLGIDVEVVNRNPDVRGFQVIERRWMVERSLGWLMLRRRLTRDYETLPTSSEAMIYIASIDNLTKRITDEATPTWRGTY